MKFQLDFSIPKAPFQMEHGDGILLLGSCFSDEMLIHFKNSGHHAVGNPYGTIFHPTVLAYNFLRLFEENTDESIFQREDLFFSWHASSSVFGYSENALAERLEAIRNQLIYQIQNAKVLIITFGTAWGYEMNETQELVANCHKMPSSMFQKVLSSSYEMTQDWLLTMDKLRALNPNLQFIFTVSPVRHVRDGLIENNLSKARLIETVQRLCIEENTHYFPSYELVVDVLRDHRFFKADLVHPSDEAIKFVWEKFSETYFSEETIQLNQQVVDVHLSLNHSSLFPESESHKKHQKSTQERVEALKKNYPKVNWD
jgi:hypothetical protein